MPPSTALATLPKDALAVQGAYVEPTEIAEMFARAQQVGHFISPATVAPPVPDGCAIVVSGVLVDQDEVSELLKPRNRGEYIPYSAYKETYAIPGGRKVGLGKVILDKIAAAVGISWGGPRDGRLDLGRDPHYCHYRAVGHFKDLGGQNRSMECDKEIDLREGAALFEEMLARARSRNEKAKNDRKPQKDEMAEIRQARLNILSLAQSKARNRVVRALGLRTSYEPEDLRKPFLVARLQYTGRSQDPAMQREFSRMTAAAMLMGSAALYGTPAPAAALTLHDAPPVGTVEKDDDDGGLPGALPAERVPEDAGYDGPPEDAAPAAEIPARPETSALVLPDTKKSKGLAVARTESNFLRWWQNAFTDTINDDKSGVDRKKKAAELLDAVSEELKYREKYGVDKVRDEAAS